VIRVLIVDDDDVLRMLMRRMLESMSCEVYDVRTGIDAQEVTQHFRPDLVLLDIMMPLQNGYETCANLREGGFAGTIVLCSSLQAKREETRTVNAGANGFIQKPFTRDSIWPILNAIRSPA